MERKTRRSALGMLYLVFLHGIEFEDFEGGVIAETIKWTQSPCSKTKWSSEVFQSVLCQSKLEQTRTYGRFRGMLRGHSNRVSLFRGDFRRDLDL